MKVGLYKLEKYPNLALEKIRVYYQSRHDVVDYVSAVEAINYDVVYCSSIFKFTKKKYVYPYMITGGTGFDLTAKLPKEIDDVLPRVNYGFTTRGCIRKCPFCVVPEKEGYIHITGDLLDLWDGKSKDIRVYDNNILALPDQFDLVCRQARDNKIKLDFNQGLDHRLLTPEIVDIMKSIRHTEYHFAFDNPSYINSVDKAITLLQSKGINRCNWYVLTGYNTTFQEDLDRCNYLRERNQNTFVQKYRDNKLGKEYTALARWANNHGWFHGVTFQQFVNRPENKAYAFLREA